MTAIVGLDLSLTSTGIAAHWGSDDIRTHRIQSKGKLTDTWDQRAIRARMIVNKVIDVIPDDSLVIIEAPSYGSKGGSQHDRSGLWWLTYHELRIHDCRVVPVAPTTRAKYGTGKGNAGKDQVLAATIRRYPHLDITGNDVADAVLLMAIGCRLTGKPFEPELPQANLDAMAKIQLP